MFSFTIIYYLYSALTERILLWYFLNLIQLQFCSNFTGCPTNMLTTSDSILEFLKPRVAKSKTCFEILKYFQEFFAKEFQNMQDVVLRIPKLSPKLSTYWWDILYKSDLISTTLILLQYYDNKTLWQMFWFLLFIRESENPGNIPYLQWSFCSFLNNVNKMTIWQLRISSRIPGRILWETLH